MESLLAGHKASDAMNSNYLEVPADTVLQELVDHHILANGQRAFVVKAGDDVVGLVTLHDVKEVPRGQWATTTAAQAMVPVGRMKWTRPDASLGDALKEMDSDGVNQLPVMADSRVTGMLTREGIISFLGAVQAMQA